MENKNIMVGRHQEKRIKGLNEQRQLRYVRNYVASRFSKYPPTDASIDILRNTLSYFETI